jgi:hypothetical protein
MPFGREQFVVEKEMNGEVIEKVYAKELIPTPIEEYALLSDEEKMLHKPYAFNQRTYEVMPGRRRAHADSSANAPYVAVVLTISSPLQSKNSS